MISNTTSPLSLFLISALHESGGGYSGRLFDGHPQLKVYPFEMQLGLKTQKEDFEGYCFQPRYRWPRFPQSLKNYGQLHRSISDTELKRYLMDRSKSKFSRFELQISGADWKRDFARRLKKRRGRLRRPAIIEAYLLSFFSQWKNRIRSQREWAILGHCPVILFDAEAIFADFPKSKMVHLVRNPIATFHDTRLRLPKLKPQEFCAIWNFTAYFAHYCRIKYPSRLLVVRYENLISKKVETLKRMCRFFGISYSPCLQEPSWNGERLNSVWPFGGIPHPSTAYERSVGKSLPKKIRNSIKRFTLPAGALYGY